MSGSEQYHEFKRRAVSRVSEQLVLHNKKKIGRRLEEKRERRRERESRKREEGGRY